MLVKANEANTLPQANIKKTNMSLFWTGSRLCRAPFMCCGSLELLWASIISMYTCLYLFMLYRIPRTLSRVFPSTSRHPSLAKPPNSCRTPARWDWQAPWCALALSAEAMYKV